MSDNPKEARNKRTNLRPNRDNIYCYDIDPGQEEGSQEGGEDHQSEDEVPVDDDSFSYAMPKNKPKKLQQKKNKAKEKGLNLPPNKPKQKK